MRLTMAHKHVIADKAVSHALEIDAQIIRAGLMAGAEDILSSLTEGLELEEAQEGLFAETDMIWVKIDGECRVLPLSKKTRVPYILVSGDYELGEGRPGYDQISGDLREQDDLEREKLRMKSELMNEILVPSTTLSGLLKKWPQVVKYLPDELRSQLNHVVRIDEILAPKVEKE